MTSTACVPAGVRVLFASLAGEYYNPMRIVCPSCSAAFEVPKTRLAPGQTVRCARCGQDWTPLAEPEPVFAAQPSALAEQPARAGSTGLAPELSSKPANAFPPTPPLAEAPKAGRLRPMLDRLASIGEPALMAGWAVSILVLAMLVWAAVTWRGDVMRAWPPSERLYTALGLPADH